MALVIKRCAEADHEWIRPGSISTVRLCRKCSAWRNDGAPILGIEAHPRGSDDPAAPRWRSVGECIPDMRAGHDELHPNETHESYAARTGLRA